jgi:hypothetical protein
MSYLVGKAIVLIIISIYVSVLLLFILYSRKRRGWLLILNYFFSISIVFLNTTNVFLFKNSIANEEIAVENIIFILALSIFLNLLFSALFIEKFEINKSNTNIIRGSVIITIALGFIVFITRVLISLKAELVNLTDISYYLWIFILLGYALKDKKQCEKFKEWLNHGILILTFFILILMITVDVKPVQNSILKEVLRIISNIAFLITSSLVFYEAIIEGWIKKRISKEDK